MIYHFRFKCILYISIQKESSITQSACIRSSMCLSFTETASLPRPSLSLSAAHARIWLASASPQACRIPCTSMFANRPDKATAVRQTQNTNINKQTNPFIHSAPSKHCVHTQPDFRALTQPAVTAPLFAALFGPYPVHLCDLVSLLIDGVRESPASPSDKALA